ncbi:hypothetical protein QBC46DRAFT_406870 [Diplogelasinospora grovesii]|uniref:Uncharacterized protein n=1 Tax=Diplogelasinospora grovesii TaxID=303347 RepID=A0AAN6NAG0_9PEZI|nr:hypothetical protein QBC46DRAFT_406870 [Diplogelasinospora grovesii]
MAKTLVEADQLPDILDISPPSKRNLVDKRATVNPYECMACNKRWPLNPVPSDPSCSRNNCFRAFPNAREGSDGFHCPSVAFNYCCQWYRLTSPEKMYVVENGLLLKYLPWTDNCGAAGPFACDDDVEDVVTKIDNVCACTLDHKVAVTLPDDYATLSRLSVRDPVCKQTFH